MRIPPGVKNQGEELRPGFLIARLVEEWLRRLVQRAHLAVPHDADHFGGDRWNLSSAAQPYGFAERVLSRPSLPGHRLVDHNHARRMALVGMGEAAPTNQRNAHRL